MKRFFSHKEKQILYNISGGLCGICKIDLRRSWHADHIIPYSLGGETAIANGQALCPKCNQKKTNKMSNKKEMRKWQNKAFAKIKGFKDDNEKKQFLLHAGVGSGKTFLATMVAIELFLKEGGNVIIASPSQNVKKNWSMEFHKNGIDVDSNFGFGHNPFTEGKFKGVSTTYQSLNENNVSFLIKNRLVSSKTLLILDEIHHLGESKIWGELISNLAEHCGFILSLTGTPFRTDNVKIPFVKYKEFDGNSYELETDFSYSYKDSVLEKVCCPVIFHSTKVDTVFSDEKGTILDDNNGNGRRAYNQEISSVLNQLYVVNTAMITLDEIRNCYKDNAAMLVVCETIAEAQHLHRRLPDSVIATSDGATSDKIINDFKTGKEKIIISVKMISEGVDIPRIRVVVFLSNQITPLFFQQVIGRGVRGRDDSNSKTLLDTCHLFYYKFQPLLEMATKIEDELRHVIIEQQEKIKKEYLERELSEHSESERIAAEIGGQSIMTAGVDLTEFDYILEDLSIDIRNRFSRHLAEFTDSLKSEEEEVLTKSEQIKKISIEIQNVVSSVVMRQFGNRKDLVGVKMKEIHNELNRRSGFIRSSEATLSQLLTKLRLAKQML